MRKALSLLAFACLFTAQARGADCPQKGGGVLSYEGLGQHGHSITVYLSDVFEESFGMETVVLRLVQVEWKSPHSMPGLRSAEARFWLVAGFKSREPDGCGYVPFPAKDLPVLRALLLAKYPAGPESVWISQQSVSPFPLPGF